MMTIIQNICVSSVSKYVSNYNKNRYTHDHKGSISVSPDLIVLLLKMVKLKDYNSSYL
jgi:hypothetical protein